MGLRLRLRDRQGPEQVKGSFSETSEYQKAKEPTNGRNGRALALGNTHAGENAMRYAGEHKQTVGRPGSAATQNLSSSTADPVVTTFCRRGGGTAVYS